MSPRTSALLRRFFRRRTSPHGVARNRRAQFIDNPVKVAIYRPMHFANQSNKRTGVGCSDWSIPGIHPSNSPVMFPRVVPVSRLSAASEWGIHRGEAELPKAGASVVSRARSISGACDTPRRHPHLSFLVAVNSIRRDKSVASPWCVSIRKRLGGTTSRAKEDFGSRGRGEPTLAREEAEAS